MLFCCFLFFFEPITEPNGARPRPMRARRWLSPMNGYLSFPTTTTTTTTTTKRWKNKQKNHCPIIDWSFSQWTWWPAAIRQKLVTKLIDSNHQPHDFQFFSFSFFFCHFFLVIITTTSMTSFSSCPRFYWFFLPSFPVCHLGFIGFYSGSTRLYWVLPGFPLFSWVLPGFTTLYLDFSHFAVINGFHLEFTWLWGDYWVFFLGFHLVFFWRHQEQNSKKEEPNEKNRRKRKKKEQQQQQQQQQQQ